jgi:hypothetical protein
MKSRQIFKDKLFGYKDVIALESHLRKLESYRDRLDDNAIQLIDHLEEHAEDLYDHLIHGHDIMMTIDLKKTIKLADLLVRACEMLVVLNQEERAQILQSIQTLSNRVFN